MRAAERTQSGTPTHAHSTCRLGISIEAITNPIQHFKGALPWDRSYPMAGNFGRKYSWQIGDGYSNNGM